MEALFQKIEIKKNRLFIIKNTECNFFDGLFHFHPEYELICILEGEGNCLIGNRLISYKGGDLFFLGPNLPHSWMSDLNFSNKSHSLVIQFNRDLWDGPFFNGQEIKYWFTVLLR